MHIPFPSPWKPVFDGGRTAEAFFDDTTPPREMIEAGKASYKKYLEKNITD